MRRLPDNLPEWMQTADGLWLPARFLLPASGGWGDASQAATDAERAEAQVRGTIRGIRLAGEPSRHGAGGLGASRAGPTTPLLSASILHTERVEPRCAASHHDVVCSSAHPRAL
jgi:hypothetical protein